MNFPQQSVFTFFLWMHVLLSYFTNIYERTVGTESVFLKILSYLQNSENTRYISCVKAVRD